MNQSQINKAVQECIHDAIRGNDPVATVQEHTQTLRASGWPDEEIDAVKKTCIRMLSAIYDVSGADGHDNETDDTQAGR